MRRAAGIFIGIASVALFGGGLVALMAERGTKSAPPAESAQEPRPQDLQIRQSLRTAGGILYALSETRGFLVSFDQGSTWIERNQGLSRRVVYPFLEQPVRRLTSLGVDPEHEARVAVTAASELFLSEDYGTSWVQIPWGKPLRPSTYFTAVALSPHEPNRLALGTSYSGFYETADRGATWRDPSLSATGQLNRGAGFYEEISGLSYDPGSPGRLWFACGFGNGLYRGDRRTWSRVEFPGDAHGELIQGLSMLPGEAGWELEVRTNASLWRLGLPDGSWSLREQHDNARRLDPFARERQRKAGDRIGMYLSSFMAQGAELERHLRFLQAHGLNALVVDCKDDFGWVTYDTGLELPKRIGAVQQRFKLEELLSRAHERGIYVVARVVVFKDRQLYNYDGSKYAVWNAASNQPWRNLFRIEEEPPAEAEADAQPQAQAAPAQPAPQPRYYQREYWVDPFSPFVWTYNTSLAEELQRRGVDEIQFDYIRFPSDGNLSVIRYRYRREGMDKIDALESFLVMARQTIHIPVSTDLYGYSTWHRMGNWIGQSTEMLADYVDVICPMYYPSHFPREFMKSEPYLERARRIYREGTRRALSVADRRALIRPYVQAFLIGGELGMGVAEYNQYLLNQVQGCLEAPSSGFTLWNASNRYYMVSSGLKPLLQRAYPPERAAANAAAGLTPAEPETSASGWPPPNLAPALD
jgi:hypothetical protein